MTDEEYEAKLSPQQLAAHRQAQREQALRDEEALARSDFTTPEALVAALEARRDVVLDTLVPLIQRDQDARAARDTLRDREVGISTLEGIISEARENAQRLMSTDVRAAVAARQEADAAQTMHDEATVQFVAVKASVDRYDFDGAALQIALLVTEREDIDRALKSTSMRQHMLAAERESILAARENVRDRERTHALLVLESSDPVRAAQAADAETRRLTKERHEAQEAAALARAPRPRPNNGGATALAEMAHGGKVSGGVQRGVLS